MDMVKEIRLEHTTGLAHEAEVWVSGHLMKVCDGLSAKDNPLRPGLIENVLFSYPSMEGFSWEQAVRANPAEHRFLDPLHSWSYTGYGQVVSIMPVVIDFGLFHMEDPNWTGDETLTGRYVGVPIDRLDISFAYEADWPDNAK